jgi:hypothetical protein
VHARHRRSDLQGRSRLRDAQSQSGLCCPGRTVLGSTGPVVMKRSAQRLLVPSLLVVAVAMTGGCGESDDPAAPRISRERGAMQGLDARETEQRPAPAKSDRNASGGTASDGEVSDGDAAGRDSASRQNSAQAGRASERPARSRSDEGPNRRVSREGGTQLPREDCARGEPNCLDITAQVQPPAPTEAEPSSPNAP